MLVVVCNQTGGICGDVVGVDAKGFVMKGNLFSASTFSDYSFEKLPRDICEAPLLGNVWHI